MITIQETCDTQVRITSQPKLKPRLGFLGVGWIGRHRLEAVANSKMAEVVAIADPAQDLLQKAAESAPKAVLLHSLDELLEFGLDGLVIATPSALHADQAVAALERGVAVFCQKPLGRNEAETLRVIDAARSADLLLGVDLSYHHMTQVRMVADLIQSGELGDIYVVDLMFHNAYGPDKAWFYDRKLSGGGCVIDLGVHLVDLALSCLNSPAACKVTSRLFSHGRPISDDSQQVEDYAVARIDLANNTTLQLSCSWKLPAGCDAIIAASFYGTKGGASFRNIDGSFYNFMAERFRGTQREILSSAQEEWGGKAAIDWTRRLSESPRFDPEVNRLIQVASILDAIYRG
ncbi:Gfo/Idh/MocA family protein [Pedosphaera parvula]|uniref:Oxidoreductase domain protein n=1 Tax=Pedosphaera parvula (strain Ellin514) TaxID=320771 RepID=B9XS79_PEDPL|nr:Gfo/Idh/MocA family oxidoreductase [Pedosphaera parvula]EEF57289.1 oxidoreductase domain protein [Pedosphaera parvula Ellin514]